MPNPQIQNDPIYSLPFTYAQGFASSWASNTTLSIAAGQCRDSNDNIDIVLGSAPLNGTATTAPVTLNAAINGVNGLDTGSLAASTMYAIYAIADSRYFKPVGVILTLASNAQPLMPFGYDSFRLIGYWPTNGSSQFTLAYVSGSGGTRQFVYDAPVATAITAGTATSYTAIDLTGIVPVVNFLPVQVQAKLTPNAASDTLKLQPQGATGDAVTIIGQVASVATQQLVTVMALVVTGKPEIAYKVSAGTDAAAINVAGFTFSI